MFSWISACTPTACVSLPPETADTSFQERTQMATRLLAVLTLCWINGANAALHSLTLIHTGSSEIPNLPEYVEVGLVDDVPFHHYDSDRKRVEPRQDWMMQLIADDPEYLERNTQISLGNQEAAKVSMRVLNEIFNHTGGVHTYQWMYGCEWDNETGKLWRGYDQYGYDGEDFISFNLETLTWDAACPQAVSTKQAWDKNEGYNKYLQNYLTQLCPVYLKTFLHYGNSSLLRTELPSVSLLQKTPSSPIVCHATGFYPPTAMMFWTKDGEELHEDVEIGEVLPNPNGTLQMMAELKLSDPSEAWERYTCVFQIGDVNRTTKLEKEAILTNWEPDRTVPNAVLVSVLVVVAVAVAAAAAAVAVVKCRRGGSSPEPCVPLLFGLLRSVGDPPEDSAHGLESSDA
ncbi:major histocompatibility complex class I-related gene protein-like isoform X2 [Synchiropus splendidus]|uniref:major histocompatibility complex class I-related gene protein-like isoform X2 n=1 Tax=Synchiropus splendidus TaxID=270530 RepID=UPI00237DE00A|nr:major histocompatibility complex class I-related gene protein-like isoform X2 [Synchiropus splendidus]